MAAGSGLSSEKTIILNGLSFQSWMDYDKDSQHMYTSGPKDKLEAVKEALTNTDDPWSVKPIIKATDAQGKWDGETYFLSAHRGGGIAVQEDENGILSVEVGDDP